MAIVELIPYVTGKNLADIVTIWSDYNGNVLEPITGQFAPYIDANTAIYDVPATNERGTTGVYEVTVPASVVGPKAMTFVSFDLSTGAIIATGTTDVGVAGFEVSNVVLEQAILTTNGNVVSLTSDIAAGVKVEDMFGLAYDKIQLRLYAALAGDREVNPAGDVEQYIHPDGVSVVFVSTIDQVTGSRTVVPTP